MIYPAGTANTENLPELPFTKSEKQYLLHRVQEIPFLIKNAVIRNPELKYPFLSAGSIYPGIWLEHNQDNLFITDIDPEAAWGSIEIFMFFQRPDGLLPAWVSNHNLQPGYGQIQTVYPFARCALELFRQLKRPEHDLPRIYGAAAKYDRWLEQYRNHTGNGLVDMFCEWDTGHDNSPRGSEGGIPLYCPNYEAKNMPKLNCMPITAADLSATRYGGLAALAEMAEILDKKSEAEHWHCKAEQLHNAVMTHLYCAEDDFFYDLTPHGWRKYRTEHITRFFLNKVVSQSMFDRIWQRYFTTPEEFLTEYPVPSVSVSDPAFNRKFPFNCWGGNTQMLTLLRFLLFMDFYQHRKELDLVLTRFLQAYIKYPGNQYTQELNPFTGEPIGRTGGYLPARLLMRESCRRFGLI